MSVARRPISSIAQVTGLQAALDAKRALAAAQTPIATYTHSGNPSAVVSAVTYNGDTPANTFTSVGHPFVDGNRVSICINPDNAAIDYATKFLPTGLTLGQFYVVGKTTDTFQLSATSGGAPVALTSIATLDLTKWHVELPAMDVTIANLPASRRIRVRYRGACSRGVIYITPSPTATYAVGAYVQTTATTIARFPGVTSGNLTTTLDVVMDSTSWLTITGTGIYANANTTTAVVCGIVDVVYTSVAAKAFDITSITIGGGYTHNGTTVEVYAE